MRQIPNWMGIALWISRILLGFIFLLSGFFKAIDPLGFTYKLQDYLLAFGMEGFFGIALPIAILISTLEIVIGVSVMLGTKIKISAFGALLFMAFFTPLTLYLALTDKVAHCGCFGDAIVLDGWTTFYKNIVLSAAAILIFAYRNNIRPLLSSGKDWLPVACTALASILLSVYCLRNLPIIDFLPWKKGNYIPEMMVGQQEVSQVFLIFQNRETQETAEFPATDYPWDDPQWMALWEYKDQRVEVIHPHVPAPISNFAIWDEFQNDITSQYLEEPGYLFIAVAYDLNQTSYMAFRNRINPLAIEIEKAGHTLIVLTSASLEAIDAFRHHHQTAYRFYQADAIALKTMIRSNPGLLLLKDGVVIDKWAHRNIPDFDTLAKSYLN